MRPVFQVIGKKDGVICVSGLFIFTIKNRMFVCSDSDFVIAPSAEELAQIAKKITKDIDNFYFHEAEIGKDPDKRNYIVSNAKIEATGFKPKVSLQEGITELIKGYRIIKQNNFTNV